MANPANILVGCGGSGIRTLMRLNGLMAEDPYWRHRIGRDIYYVLLDTELAMIDEFEDTINRQLAGVDKPLIWSLRIAQGHVILHPLVRRYFVTPFAGESNNTRGKDRLYSHWWCDDEHGPFSAPKVRPLTKGAGQCPAVSYFLTWHGLRKVEDVFDRLIEEVIARRSDATGVNPLAELNFAIVAGLAGGTGRGSWQLIAFKVRELLTKRHDTIPVPVAYLYDASVFESVYRRYPRQEVPMKVNALTGVSEISCWLNQSPTSARLRYELPSMETPHDPQMDVLSLDLDLDPSGASPVDNVYLMFNRNEMAVLSDNEQYHDMVGTGLYAALSRSSIASTKINERPPYMSLGTATFEVNSATLRQYFEGLNRISALKQLATRDDVAVGKAVDKFFNSCGLPINITATNRRGFQADEKGTLIQRACHELVSRCDLGGLVEALEDDDPEEVEDAIRNVLQPDEQAAENAIQAAVDSLPMDPSDAAKQQVAELFRDTRSVENVRRFVEQVIERLEGELDDLPAADRMKTTDEEDPQQLVHAYKGREYVVWGRHFNPDECNDLENQTRIALLYANYSVLCAELKQRYKSWMAIIRRWQDSSDVIRAAADKLAVKFRNEVQDDIGTSGSEDADFFDALFTDFEYPERSTPDEFSKGRFYRRELRPVLHRGQDLELLGQPEFKQEFTDVVSKGLTSGLTRDSYDECDKFRRDLESAVRKTVHLPSRFIENNFSVLNVITGLRQAWLHRFHEMKGQRDELRDMVKMFEAFYGSRPHPDGDEYVLPTNEEFMLYMGASLAATCRPYWRLRSSDEMSEARVSLFLPILEDQFKREAAERFIAERLDRGNVTVEVFTEKERPDELGDSRANPFIIVAYSVEGTHDINAIASLDYWQTPTVKALLQECENVGGKSVFDPDAQHNGVSFTDPLFIGNPELQGIRWKPWIDLDVDRTMQNKETMDALLYAFLQPNEEFNKQLQKLKWTLPLIRNKGKKWYEFTRRAIIWNDGRPKADTGCEWKARQPIAQGLDETFAVLSGTARTPDGSLKTEGSRWADRVRQEARTFWAEVLLELQAPPRSTVYEQLLADLETTLDENAQASNTDEDEHAIWLGLLNRLKELRDLGEL